MSSAEVTLMSPAVAVTTLKSPEVVVQDELPTELTVNVPLVSIVPLPVTSKSKSAPALNI